MRRRQLHYTTNCMLLGVWVCSICLGVCSELDNAQVIDANKRNEMKNGDDPIELVDLGTEVPFFYDNYRIIEKSNEEIYGKAFKPMYESFEKKSRNIKVKPKRLDKVEQNNVKESPYVPLEKRWDYVKNYHMHHSVVEESDLEKRFNLLIKSRDNQTQLEKDPSSKVLIYYPRKAGLGNTVTALADVLLLAIASNRRFLVYDWAPIFDYLVMPFDHVSLSDNIWKGDDQLVLSTDKGNCGLDLLGIINGTETRKHIIIRSSCGIERFFIHDRHVREWLVDNGIIDTPKMHEVDIYHRLMQFLLVDAIHPRENIIEGVNAFKNSVNWDNYTIIGIHLRTGLLEGNVGWGRFIEEDDVNYFLMQANRQSLNLKRHIPNKDVKWFVLADNEGVKSTLAKEAGDRFLTANCTIAHSKNRNANGMYCSFVENYLLSDCNFLILTYKSTFGYLAKHRTDVSQLNVLPGSWKKIKPKYLVC